MRVLSICLALVGASGEDSCRSQVLFQRGALTRLRRSAFESFHGVENAQVTMSPPEYVKHEVLNEKNGTFMLPAASGRNLVFLHIPKNAGTSVEAAAQAHNMSWGAYDKNNLWKHVLQPHPKCSTWHIPPSYFDAGSPYMRPNSEVFAIVRDPWDRMVSEYQWQAIFLDLFQAGASGNNCSSSRFNMWLQISLAREEYSAGSADCHFLQQWDYIQGPGGDTYVPDANIILLENLSTAFPNLMKRFNLDVILGPASNSAKMCAKLNDMPKNELYDSESKALMRAHFHKDFQHLGDRLAGM